MMITCVHCGKPFVTKRLDNLTSSSNGSRGVQHSPGCMKITNVHYNRGNITRIT
jgi:hypothetical protein